MAERRVKSIMHGSAPSTRVYHHEHRSSKGRIQGYKRKRLITKFYTPKNVRQEERFLRKVKHDLINKTHL